MWRSAPSSIPRVTELLAPAITPLAIIRAWGTHTSTPLLKLQGDRREHPMCLKHVRVRGGLEHSFSLMRPKPGDANHRSIVHSAV